MHVCKMPGCATLGFSDLSEVVRADRIYAPRDYLESVEQQYSTGVSID
jgi:hypothetical protein